MRPSPLSLCLCLSLSLSVAARADDAPDRRTISVSSEGEVHATPDLAIISFAVETTAPEAAAAVGENARKSAALSKAIKSRMDAADKISTSGYGLDPVYEQAKPGSSTVPRISGYVARNEVRVEAHKLDAVGALIDAAAGAGANRVSGLTFTLENRSAQLREALQKAGAEARQQAESVATALGVRLKQVVSASTSGGPIVMPKQYERMAMASMESYAPTPVEAGDVVVRAGLQVTYEIE